MFKTFKFIKQVSIFLTILGITGQLLPITGGVKVVRASQEPETMCAVPVDVVLIMDASGSMTDGALPSQCQYEELKWIGGDDGSFQCVSGLANDVSEQWCQDEQRNVSQCHPAVYTGASQSKQEHAEIAADSFINNLGSIDQSAVVSFNDTAVLAKELSNDHSLSQAIIDGLVSQGATNIGSAIEQGIVELGSSRAQLNSNKVLILLTDGKANKPNGNGFDENVADVQYAKAKAQEAANFGFKIFTVGLGDDGDINAQMLQEIAGLTGATYHHAPNGSDLSDIYQQIAFEVCQIEPEPPMDDGNATSTDDGNATSTDNGDATSTDNGSATSTDNGNTTSTDDGQGNATSTDDGQGTSTSTEPTTTPATTTDQQATTTESTGSQETATSTFPESGQATTTGSQQNNSGPSRPGYGQGVFIPLAIFDEKIDAFSQSSITLSWRTNRLAGSRVVFGPSSLSELSTGGFYGYPASTETSDNPLFVLNHYLTINNLTPGFTYYLRPVSKNSDLGEVISSQELSVYLEPTIAAGFSTSSESSSQNGNGQCSYLNHFLRFGQDNSPAEVEKLQKFLNDFEGQALVLNGLFDQATLEAVKAFQAKYQEDILDPWGEIEPTGYVYITTRQKINELYCGQTIALTPEETAEIEAYRQLFGSDFQGQPQPGATSTSPLIGQIDLETIGQSGLPGLPPLSWQDLLRASLAQLYYLTK